MLEWDEIDAEEARAGDNDFDDAVLVKGRSHGKGTVVGGPSRLEEGLFGVESIMTVRALSPAADGQSGGGREAGERKGTSSAGSGWMKLKSRP